MTKLFRQGDILLQEIKEIPTDVTVKETGICVLAYGESTGHKHQIQQATLLMGSTQETYLQVEKPAQLTHEEHDAIMVPAGNYVVLRQREYTPSAPRTISD